jgi:cold shock CspA family protein
VAKSLEALEQTLAIREGHQMLQGRIAGFDYEKGYGFIEQRQGTERVFFHKTDLRDRGTEVLLLKAPPVSFAVPREEKGLRGSAVHAALAPEAEADVLRNRQGRVASKRDDFLFVADAHTHAPVFVGSFCMRSGDWKRVAVGDHLAFDIELMPRGPRAVRGTVRPIQRK